MSAPNTLLKLVREEPGLFSTALASKAGITAQRASEELAKLYKRGDLTRKSSVEGGKRVYLYYPAGKQAPMPAAPAAAPVAAPLQQESPLGDMLSSFVQSVSGTLAELIITRVETQLVERLSQLSAKIPERVAPIVAEAKVVKKRVLICGLLPQQAGIIQSEFHECLDLRFLSVDDGVDRFKSNAAHADHVILMTDFISHRHQQSVESVGAKPILVSGGMSKLKDKLTELYME